MWVLHFVTKSSVSEDILENVYSLKETIAEGTTEFNWEQQKQPDNVRNATRDQTLHNIVDSLTRDTVDNVPFMKHIKRI